MGWCQGRAIVGPWVAGMTVADALSGVRRLGLDTAPIIYFVEGNADFHAVCVPFFAAIDDGQIEAFTSTIAMTETLVHPLRANDIARAAAFRDLLTTGPGISTIPLSATIAERAAQLRADHNLRTPDAIQIATALATGCDAFLTNDVKLKRITQLRVIVVDDLIA